MEHQTMKYNASRNEIPECFATKRTTKDIWDKYILSGILLAVGCALSTKSWLEFFLTSCANYLYLVILEVLSRITSIREEYSHLKSRYDGNTHSLLYKTFNCNKKTVCCTVLVLFLAIIVVAIAIAMQQNIMQYINSVGNLSWMLTFAGIKLLTDLIELDKSTVNVAKIIDRLNCLDYGSGMATNFFYGYLNFMLPPTGEERKGLKENILDFASRHGVTFASTKLFIFLPLSGKCPPNAADYSPRGLLEQSEIVEPKKLNKGGVRQRDYHNTVYKLHIGEKEPPVYVCCEFASALQTLHKVTEHNHEMSGFYREHKKELILNFFMTINKLVKEKNYSNMCEFIFFQDKDENGYIYEDRLDIGDLLLTRLPNIS